MNKEGPSLGRLAAMVAFSLSCFALLLFLWVSFGGSVPLRANQYELMADFPNAKSLAQQADVRISGVTVGKVHKTALDKGGNRTLATLYIDPKYAPLPRDSEAILRQKTLLGETYVELTPGHRNSGMLTDGSLMPNSHVEPTVELDEILRIFDPATKQAFRSWVQESAKTVRGSAPQDFSDALGNLAGFAQDGAGLLSVLNTQSFAVRQLISNTGVVFGALNKRQGQLANLVVKSNDTFGALSSEQRALADTFRVFPTFLDESKSTLTRLQRFAVNTQPLVDALKPVADNLGPTVQDVSGLAPDLQTLFVRLKPLIRDSRVDLPAGSRVLRGLSPVLDSLHVFLPQLNPILSYLDFNQSTVAQFLSHGGSGFYHLNPESPGVPNLALAQYAATNNNSIGFQQTDPAYDRGNAYPAPNAYQRQVPLGILESFSCRNTTSGAEQRDPNPSGTQGTPPCFVAPPSLYNGHIFPFLQAGQVRLKPSPQGGDSGNSPANANRPLVSR